MSFLTKQPPTFRNIRQFKYSRWLRRRSTVDRCALGHEM